MFICSACQKSYSKWQGKCDGCNSWNSLSEAPEVKLTRQRGSKKSATSFEIQKPVKLEELVTKNNNDNLITTGIGEFDNTVGGRLINGQVVLLAGAPGIGKSTLSLQITEGLSKKNKKILYVCGEESPEQIKHRADRLKLKLQNVLFLPETNAKKIETYVASHSNEIQILFIDSIQTLYNPEIPSTSGSVSQISECTNLITNLSKGFGITTFIIGHITKSGDIAGPMILEHMVDTVLFFEGDKRNELRILRVEKNRFGSTDEAGIFKMSQNGLTEVLDTKELFNSNSGGSVYSIVLEGTRPIVVEVQALATKSYFPNPRRTTSGFDINRLYILLAIIEKKLKLRMGEYDVYLNITGGLKITDPGLDLAVIKAVVSSVKDLKLNSSDVYFGEVGLNGEVRKVFLEEKRNKEANRIGFAKVYNSFIKNINSLN